MNLGENMKRGIKLGNLRKYLTDVSSVVALYSNELKHSMYIEDAVDSMTTGDQNAIITELDAIE